MSGEGHAEEGTSKRKENCPLADNFRLDLSWRGAAVVQSNPIKKVIPEIFVLKKKTASQSLERV